MILILINEKENKEKQYKHKLTVLCMLWASKLTQKTLI